MASGSELDDPPSGNTEIEDLFRQLLLLPPARREGFLNRVRGENPELVQEIHLLLLADLAATEEGFLTPLTRSSGPVGSSSHVTIQTPGLVAEWDMETASFGHLFSGGRYELLERLGKGGFAEVWKARDTDLHRQVAIKIPRPDKQFSARILEMFLSEARKTAQLNCPGIVEVHDVGYFQGKPYVVSELMAGGSLQELLKQGPLPLDRSLQLIIRIAEALHQAHRAGLVHRDIKPANILLDAQGQPAVADFGLAATEADQLTEGPSVVGTVAYMSPEQVQGQSHWANPQSDIYSLGVMLYELTTRRLPFVANEFAEYRQQILHRVPRAPRLYNPDISPELERICLKCLSKAPENRYATAADLAGELRRLDQRPPEPVPPPTRRHWLPVAVVAALLLGGGWYFFGNRGTVPHPPQTQVVAVPDGPPPVQPPAQLVLANPAPDNPPPEKPLPRELPPVINGLTIRELNWPGKWQEEQSWHFRDQHKLKPLVISSRGISLVGLGELGADQVRQGVTLEIDLQKPAWSGACGLFWGYREALLDGQFQAEFQLLQVISVGEPQIVVHRGLTRINPDTGTLLPMRGIQAGPFLIGQQPPHLKLTIQEGRLTSVFLDDHSLVELVETQHNNLYPVEQYPGVWGVFNRDDTTWFINPKQAVHPQP